MREDWVECKLGELANLITKGATPTTYGFKFQSHGINFLKVENVKNGIVEVKSIINFISEDAHNYQKKSQLELNDILFSIAGTIGNTCLIKQEYLPANTNQAFAIIRGTKDSLLPKFLVFQLNSFVENLKILSRGGAMLNVSLQDLKDFNTLVPPLPEQRAIVKKIEALFSSLDAGIADLKKAQEQLKIYRQAVLKKAFEGEKENMLLKDIAVVKRGKSKHRPRNDKRLFGGNYPFIQTGEIRKANGGIIKTYENTYSEFGLEQSKLWPKGTLCLTIAANIGETAFLGFDACFPDSVVGIIPDETILNINYFNYFIQLTKSELDRKASATAQKNINVEFLEALEIPVFSLSEQSQIVKEIEARLSVCDAVEKQIQDSLDQAEALRQSILKKAFEGRLLSEEELNLCKQASDYEPASVLLEKIKAEKDANKPVKKKTTKKK